MPARFAIFIIQHAPERAVESIVPLEGKLRLGTNTLSAFEWNLFFHGARRYEPEVRAMLRRFIRPGHAAIDVGANIGIHTPSKGRAQGHTHQNRIGTDSY